MLTAPHGSFITMADHLSTMTMITTGAAANGYVETMTRESDMKVRITAIYEVELEADNIDEAREYLINDPEYWHDAPIKIKIEEIT